ncbi:hypothetical protein BASA81_002347 [Batrachochytrium salamandrivorans]|nr:hypothetical protein BASA81_002347 [Batrachochytrium salamandrivorans]
MLRDFDACKLEALLAVSGFERRRETVSLEECLGRISAEDVYSPCNIPAHPTSIKDGYAVHSADVTSLGQEFEILFVDLAGNSSVSSVLTHGKAAYVTTGSPIPFGSDAVVEIEQTTSVDSGRVRINLAALAKGKDVRQVGSDLKLFELVVRKGCGIGLGEIGALASIGKFVEISVYCKPTVGVLTTGDELVEGGTGSGGGLGYGQVYDCNKPMLLAAVRELGCLGVDLGLVRDSEAGLRLKQVIAQAFETVDLVITTGGVSVGAADCVRLLLLQNSVEFTVLFDRVNTKPGKPVTCAIRHDHASAKPQVMFCLPGNPVSALAMFQTLVAPCLRKLKGCNSTDPNAVMSITTCELVLDPRPEFLRATLQVDCHTGLLHSTPTAGGLQRSSCVMSLVGCDALICLPSATQVIGGVLPQGSLVRTVVFSDWRNTKFPERNQGPKCCLIGSPSLPVLLERLFVATQSRSSQVSVVAHHDLDSLSKTIIITITDFPLPAGFLPIPGIAQFLRERLGIWRELVIGCVPSNCVVLVNFPSILEEENITMEEFIHLAWPLLTGALQEMITKS